LDSVKQIIEITGGMGRLRERPITVEVEGFMRLVIEHVGRGPRGGVLVSVAHYFEQAGDLMRDPEVLFEVLPHDGGWSPVSYTQDNLGLYHEAVHWSGDTLITDSTLALNIAAFARQWSANLDAQGFVEAARRLAES
jgi:hypothetical protein